VRLAGLILGSVVASGGLHAQAAAWQTALAEPWLKSPGIISK
jgi:hypothetical protein